MAVTKEDAIKAYGEGKVRRLYTIEGHEAQQHFVSGERLWAALTDAVDMNSVFVTFDGENFGVYEVTK